MNKLVEIYSQIPSSRCPPTCGRCCGPVFPSLAEIRNIKDWCQQHNRGYKEFILDIDKSCPYLGENKECTIYLVRPFLCRMCGVAEDLPCPIGKLTPSKVLNHNQSSALYSQIYLHGKEKSRVKNHKQLLAKLVPGI